jgi:ribonuclease HI
MGRFGDIRLIKVKGHAGHPQNERADRLAVAAVSAGTADNE